MGLLTLPDELITRVLNHAHARDVIHFQMVCRTLRDLVQASVQLQYHIDLFSACMVEGDRHGLPYDKCRRDLRLREQAWHELRWRKRIEVQFPYSGSMVSGVELVGRVLYVFENQDSMFARVSRTVLPTLMDDEEAHWQPIWEELDFDCQAQYAYIDVSQDLLGLSEMSWDQQSLTYKLHLRTLSTNSSHPRTRRSILEGIRHPDRYFQTASVQTAGDYIGVLSIEPNSVSGPTFFDLWNWHTGELHQHVMSGEKAWTSFLFLNSRTLLFPSTGRVLNDGALDVFAITGDSTSMHHTASFLLPSRLDSKTNMQAYFRERLVMVQTMQTIYEQIHVSDADQSIIVIQLTLSLDGRGEEYALVVKKATLLSDDHQSRNVTSQTPMIIPWHVWNKKARMLPDDFDFCCVHGTRYVGLHTTNHGPRWSSLHMYDFNTRRRSVQLDQDVVARHDREIVTVVEESTIQSKLFADPVRTSLPYYVVSAGPTSAWTFPVMDENCLIIVPTTFKHDSRAEVLIM